MAVDKNLFLYDLAIASSMKYEAPYLKEWLDYHLLAGVDHFYIYDHESPDNLAEVAKPYVEAGIVDYTFAPSSNTLIYNYNELLKRYRFQCRYMAIVDTDEFLSGLEELLAAAYDNRSDIRERVKKIVPTYHEPDPAA